MAMQLWIGGVRIDSMSMLRRLFASVAGDVLDARCDEVLEKIADGIFIPWLDRCDETRERVGGLERQECGNMSHWRDILHSDPDKGKLSSDAQSALAMICDVPKEKIASAVERKVHADRKTSVTSDELKKSIAEQSWYMKDESIQATLENVRWDRVATDSDTLRRIVARLPHDNAPVDVYLCDVGKPFVIRALESLANVRLIGFGSPNVQFAANCRGRCFDMIKQNVKFKDFRLACQGVLLVNEYGRHINVEIQR